MKLGYGSLKNFNSLKVFHEIFKTAFLFNRFSRRWLELKIIDVIAFNFVLIFCRGVVYSTLLRGLKKILVSAILAFHVLGKTMDTFVLMTASVSRTIGMSLHFI